VGWGRIRTGLNFCLGLSGIGGGSRRLRGLSTPNAKRFASRGGGGTRCRHAATKACSPKASKSPTERAAGGCA
jgi:hypothetical protein